MIQTTTLYLTCKMSFAYNHHRLLTWLVYRTASIDVIGTILLVACFRLLTNTGATDMAIENVSNSTIST
jgi:hypothetical protein